VAAAGAIGVGSLTGAAAGLDVADDFGDAGGVVSMIDDESAAGAGLGLASAIPR